MLHSPAHSGENLCHHDRSVGNPDPSCIQNQGGTQPAILVLHTRFGHLRLQNKLCFTPYSFDARSGTRPIRQLSYTFPCHEAPRHSQCLCRYHLHPCPHPRSALLQKSSCRGASPSSPRPTRDIDKRYTTHRAGVLDQASQRTRHRAGVALPHRRIRLSRREPHRVPARRTGLHWPQHGANHGRSDRARGNRRNSELHGHPGRPCRPVPTHSGPDQSRLHRTQPVHERRELPHVRLCHPLGGFPRVRLRREHRGACRAGLDTDPHPVCRDLPTVVRPPEPRPTRRRHTRGGDRTDVLVAVQPGDPMPAGVPESGRCPPTGVDHAQLAALCLPTPGRGVEF